MNPGDDCRGRYSRCIYLTAPLNDSLVRIYSVCSGTIQRSHAIVIGAKSHESLVFVPYLSPFALPFIEKEQTRERERSSIYSAGS